MLYYIQNPRNRYQAMEINPIGSKDVLHGVPTLYKEIMVEITDHVDRAKNPNAYINVDQVDENEEPGVEYLNTEEEDKIFTRSFTHDEVELKDEDDDAEEDFFNSMFKKDKPI